MKFDAKSPPRTFEAGYTGTVVMRDCGSIALESDEQVTFTTSAGGEYDVARKSWGFYATPSLNSRLPRFRLRAALAKSWQDRYFVYLVEMGQEAEFAKYLEAEHHHVVAWLDNDEALGRIEALFESASQER
jgi:hypothetical protein